jgi:hypothetical protein
MKVTQKLPSLSELSKVKGLSSKPVKMKVREPKMQAFSKILNKAKT